jgi:hypothetical protein
MNTFCDEKLRFLCFSLFLKQNCAKALKVLSCVCSSINFYINVKCRVNWVNCEWELRRNGKGGVPTKIRKETVKLLPENELNCYKMNTNNNIYFWMKRMTSWILYYCSHAPFTFSICTLCTKLVLCIIRGIILMLKMVCNATKMERKLNDIKCWMVNNCCTVQDNYYYNFILEIQISDWIIHICLMNECKKSKKRSGKLPKIRIRKQPPTTCHYIILQKFQWFLLPLDFQKKFCLSHKRKMQGGLNANFLGMYLR